jgi:hypothetical protein
MNSEEIAIIGGRALWENLSDVLTYNVTTKKVTKVSD